MGGKIAIEKRRGLRHGRCSGGVTNKHTCMVFVRRGGLLDLRRQGYSARQKPASLAEQRGDFLFAPASLTSIIYLLVFSRWLVEVSVSLSWLQLIRHCYFVMIEPTLAAKQRGIVVRNDEKCPNVQPPASPPAETPHQPGGGGGAWVSLRSPI